MANNVHQKNVVSAGSSLKAASDVMIMIHGRGATAEDILSLASFFNLKDFAFLAPQATNHTWYPYSFMAPTAQNEPWLSSALSLIKEIVYDVNSAGIATDHIYLLGFSQGACLMLEFAARNANRYGGIIAFTGGLIGNQIDSSNYKNDFKNTPIFIGSSNPDPHVPVARVKATTKILRGMNADVTEKIFENMGHTISPEEIKLASRIIFHQHSNE
jgi:phospholipase/carboxylesterase